MKNSELNRLVAQYKEIKQRQKKKHADNFRLAQMLKELEHRYFHETGRTLKSDFKEFKEK